MLKHPSNLSISPALLKSADSATKLLKALANKKRLLILCHLGDGEMSVGELADHVGLSLSALSQHLAGLRLAGIVSSRRQAREIRYRVKAGPAGRLMATLVDIYCGPTMARNQRRRATGLPSADRRSGRRAGLAA
jgi:ArsR family transcriptional regulator, virulence genes transcriptional regulator